MATVGIADHYRQWVHYLNERDWKLALEQLAKTINFNGTDIPNSQLLDNIKQDIEAIPDKKTSLDLVIIDKSSEKLAARLIHSGTAKKPYHGVEVTGKNVQWVEHMLCCYKDGKIYRIATFEDLDSLRRNDNEVSPAPSLDSKKPADPVDLKEAYREYVHSINTLTMKEEFPKYCQPHLTHNNRYLSIDEYRMFIEKSFDDIQGLTFNVKEVVVDDDAQYLAARIEFGGRSVKEFMGIPPSGKEIDLTEHVYYAFNEGKITRVWALLDLEAYRKRCMERAD